MQTTLQTESPRKATSPGTLTAISVAISASSDGLRGKLETLVRRPGARVVDERAQCDVLLLALDSSTSLPSSILALSLLAPSGANVCIIWFGGAPSRSTVSRLLHAGVAGMVSPDVLPAAFEAVLHAIRAGLQVIDPAFTRQEFSINPEPSLEDLTHREQQVLAMMAEGLSNKEISSRLAISTHTVKFHISSILGKLGAASRTEAVSIGVRSGRLTI
jgi:DNA-binding NarL/FixJ family response regulator